MDKDDNGNDKTRDPFQIDTTMLQDPRNQNKSFFVKLNMLKVNLKDKKHVEKFSV